MGAGNQSETATSPIVIIAIDITGASASHTGTAKDDGFLLAANDRTGPQLSIDGNNVIGIASKLAERNDGFTSEREIEKVSQNPFRRAANVGILRWRAALG